MSEDKPKAMVKVKDGDMVAENPEGLLKVAQMHLRSGMLPRHYDTIEKVVTASTWARELGLKPLTALRQIAVINGNPSLWGDMPLALARRSPDFEWIREFFVDAEFNEICVRNKNLNAAVYGAVCVTKRKGAPEHETFFTLDDKKQAGISSPVWNKYTKDMLLYRARSRNLKSSFPECLNGANIAEYDQNVMPEIEGKVISSVRHDGQRSRMEEIREQFIKQEEPSEPKSPIKDEPSESPRADNGHGGGKKKKGHKKVAKKQPTKVGVEEPVEEHREVLELRTTDQP